MKRGLALVLGLLAAACSDAPDAQSGGVSVQISGEEAATDGFLFPTGSEVAFADGWSLTFSHVLVTVAEVTLAENPDKAPADQSQTDAVVARQAGPWAVDLAVAGDAAPVGGEGSATALTHFAAQNLRDGRAFEPDRRYAFGYRLVEASDAAARVNFAGDEATEALYARMIAEGYAVLYAGTATFEGEGCATSDAAYDFEALPREVPFELGFATPTHYRNCQNQENQGEAFEGEEYQRGISVLPNRPAVAQVTLHLEHPFFSDTVHDSPLFFDQMAARRAGAEAPLALTVKDLVGVDPTAFADQNGQPLPWRVCPTGDAAAELPPGKQRSFGVGHVLVDPAGDPREVFRDYADYVRYLQSAQGHLNGGEGLCSIERDFTAPK
jgi:hypothetical protein